MDIDNDSGGGAFAIDGNEAQIHALQTENGQTELRAAALALQERLKQRRSAECTQSRGMIHCHALPWNLKNSGILHAVLNDALQQHNTSQLEAFDKGEIID
jgi:hypothetical protein